MLAKGLSALMKLVGSLCVVFSMSSVTMGSSCLNIRSQGGESEGEIDLGHNGSG